GKRERANYQIHQEEGEAGRRRSIGPRLVAGRHAGLPLQCHRFSRRGPRRYPEDVWLAASYGEGRSARDHRLDLRSVARHRAGRDRKPSKPADSRRRVLPFGYGIDESSGSALVECFDQWAPGVVSETVGSPPVLWTVLV